MAARLLRGCRWILLAAGAGLLAGATLGYVSSDMVYRSEGIVEIEPLLPHAALNTADSGVLVMFDSYVESQMARIGSPAVIEAAIHSPAWQSLGPRDAHDDAQRMRRQLRVHRPTGSRTQIRIAFHDANPRAAAQGLAAILDAYETIARTWEPVPQSDAIDDIIAQRDVMQARLDRVDAELAARADEMGADAIDAAYRNRLAEMRKLELALVDVRVAQSMLEVEPATATNDVADERDRLMRLARFDTELNSLLAQHRELVRRLEDMQHTMGDRARAVMRTHDELDAVRQRIDKRAAEVERMPVRVVNVEVAGVDGRVTLTADELAALASRLEQKRAEASREAKSLAQQQATLRELRDRAATYRQKIDDARYRIEQLVATAPIGGRVRVVNRGEPVASPYVDDRARRAAAGGMLGLVLAGGLAAFFVLLDQRLLRADAMDTGRSDAPLLGVVPAINRDPSDAYNANVTALSIHEIRALLQARAKQRGQHAFAVTSPGAGAGKTSLTVGLASSLALSGTRTLLVDCELAGRVLGGRHERGPAGQSPHASHPQSLDEVMLDMGFLNERDTEIFLLPEDSDIGLLGMLNGKPLAHCIVETNIEGLSVLPALSAQSQHIARLGGAFIRRLIDEARDSYDVVLFDTGPIPGSVEAMVVASEVDGVVLVVPRGEMQHRLTRTLSYLRLVGAKLVGTVFNRAAASDLTQHAPAPMRGSAKRTTAPLLGASRTAGSGILAAAVHSQAKSDLARKLATPDSASTTTDYDAHMREGEAEENDQQVTLEDTGAIADILLEDDDQGPKPVITADPDKIKPRRKRPDKA